MPSYSRAPSCAHVPLILYTNPYLRPDDFAYTAPMPLSADKVRTLCALLLDAEVDDMEFPGGSSRDSVRVKIGALGLIVTHRKNYQRARLESTALRFLNQSEAPVPHLIAYRDNYLIQQDLGNRRLSQSMREGSDAQVRALVGAALQSLFVIHEAGRNNEAAKHFVTLGYKPQWLANFVRSAERLGIQLNLPAPGLRFDELTALLTVAQPSFIKWDARPGNAVVRDSGDVFWIDWEHCGRRHPLDDVAWLLTDEYTPHLPDAQDKQIMEIVPAFANGYAQAQALEYLRVFGTLHSCIRLALMLRYQAKDGWWDYDRCLHFDSVGVVQELAVRVAQRGAHWAQHSQLTKALTPWFDTVLDKIANLEQKKGPE